VAFCLLRFSSVPNNRDSAPTLTLTPKSNPSLNPLSRHVSEAVASIVTRRRMRLPVLMLAMSCHGCSHTLFAEILVADTAMMRP